MASPLQLVYLTGPDTGDAIDLIPGETLRFGSDSKWCDVAIDWDAGVSAAHFTVDTSQTSSTLRDLNTELGTSVNGVRIKQAVLRNGDHITAGKLMLVVKAVGEEAQAADAGAALAHMNRSERVLTLLQQSGDGLFALLDAARDPRVAELLVEGNQETLCLFEGQAGAALALQAPYLVQINLDTPFARSLVQEGWGKSWGVYLNSGSPLYETREHLRQFLFVKDDQGKKLYFRFYDPRILRAFLPVCNAPETAMFFGPVKRFLVESEDAGHMLSFTPGPEGVARESLDVGAPKEADRVSTA